MSSTTTSSSQAQPFEFPWLYDFPPYFTIQPNQTTRIKQLDSWCSLVTSYCRTHRKFELDRKQARTWPLFHNSRLNRTLPEDGILMVLEELATDGKFVWHDKKDKRTGFVMWYTLEEWANILYEFAQKRGLRNSVCTFTEILECPAATGMDRRLLVSILKRLEAQNRAEVIERHELEGVKFF